LNIQIGHNEPSAGIGRFSGFTLQIKSFSRRIHPRSIFFATGGRDDIPDKSQSGIVNPDQELSGICLVYRRDGDNTNCNW